MEIHEQVNSSLILKNNLGWSICAFSSHVSILSNNLAKRVIGFNMMLS